METKKKKFMSRFSILQSVPIYPAEKHGLFASELFWRHLLSVPLLLCC